MTPALVLTVRGLRKGLRNPAVVVQTFFFPILLLGVLLAAFSETVEPTIDGEYADRLVPLLVLTAAAFGALGVGARLVVENQNGLTARLRSLPLGPYDVLAGRVGAEVVRVLLSAVVLAMVGHLAGFRFSQGPIAALGFFAIAGGFGMVFAVLISAVATDARNPEAVVALNPVLLLLLFFNAGFVPVDAYPEIAQPLVEINPYTPAVEAMVGLSQGGPVTLALLQTVAWILALTVLFGAIAISRYRRLQGA